MEEKSVQHVIIGETKLQCLSASTLLVAGELSEDMFTNYVTDLKRMAEKFKLKAHFLEAEQECLLATFSFIKSAAIKDRNDKMNEILEEIQTTLSMVDVRIRVERNLVEEEALHHINMMINNLIFQARNDVKRTAKVCSTLIESYLKYKDPSIEITNDNEDIHESIPDFNCLMKKCTLDDQRHIEKRLRGLLHYYKDADEKISSLIVSE